MRKSSTLLVATMVLALSSIAANSHAATINNGAPCSKVGAKASVALKGAKVSYTCKSNPTSNFKTISWIQQRCLDEFNLYQQGVDSIASARPVYRALTEPDRTKALSQLDASQTSLDQLLVKMKQNHCKPGA